MKIINIQSCGVCPYCKEFPSLDGLRCIKKGRRVVIDSELPDWCPLEDAPEKHKAGSYMFPESNTFRVGVGCYPPNTEG